MPSIPDRCPDSGSCHHECPEGGACFRVLTCGPLSIAGYPHDEWPEAIVEEHRARQTPEVGANAEWDLFVHSDPSVEAQGGVRLPLKARVTDLQEVQTVDLCRWADCQKSWTEHSAYFEDPPPDAREGDFGGGIRGLYCPGVNLG